MKGKKIGIVVIEIFIILLGFVGMTLAIDKLVSEESKINLQSGDFFVDYKGDMNANVDNLEPINDDIVNINTKNGVIRLDFSVKGTKENPDNTIIYDIIMTDINIDCPLLNKYTKWNLYKNGQLLSNGNMSPEFDGNVYKENLKLTNIQEDLPRYNEKYDNYTFIMWISESCNNINDCSLVNQNEILDATLSFKVFVALYSGTKVENTRVPNYDTSCASVPILYNNMIPVYYKNGNTIKANKDNGDEDNLWYNYNDKKWANSVIVNKDIYYEGEIIPEEDILAYYVWIPKYSYKTWNINNEINYQAYDAYGKGIDIKFSDGTIQCIDNKCNGNNLEYYTHPAFNSIKGFWVSKYEVSNDMKFIPNKEVYTHSDVNKFINKFDTIPRLYKLKGDIDSKVIDNLEWGAIAYLSHSKYGNLNIESNDSYISGKNINDSTTGNQYGVFDMSGGASEYVYTNSSLGSATQEILLDNSTTWNNNYYEYDTENSYYIRGGLQRGIYSYTTFNESSPLISSRNILKEKSSD